MAGELERFVRRSVTPISARSLSSGFFPADPRREGYLGFNTEWNRTSLHLAV
jgi:hypothetical protein